MMKAIIFVFVFCFLNEIVTSYGAPQQVHLAITQDPTEMRAQWATESEVGASVCLIGTQSGKNNIRVTGTNFTYPEGGFSGMLHSVKFTNLTPGTQYFYKCGDGQEFSQEFSFYTRSINQAKISLAVIGDMGITNSGNTIKWMTQDTLAGKFDLLMHYGDISYADDYSIFGALNNSWVNDQFMNSIQDIAARIPYMVSPGNHDTQFDYAAYKHRWEMPVDPQTNPYWYSFDYGMVHFLGFNTEQDFSKGSVQNEWIRQDLEKAAANRDQVPWIIVFGHRPLYCSSIAMYTRCEIEAPQYREALEDYFMKYKVDIYFSGHNHNYERTFPMYQSVATNTSDPSAFYNPEAPVYVLQGAAGNIEPLDPTDSWPGPSWRAALDRWHYGYGRLSVSSNRLDWEFVQVEDSEALVVDHFSIFKS